MQNKGAWHPQSGDWRHADAKEHAEQEPKAFCPACCIPTMSPATAPQMETPNMFALTKNFFKKVIHFFICFHILEWKSQKEMKMITTQIFKTEKPVLKYPKYTSFPKYILNLTYFSLSSDTFWPTEFRSSSSFRFLSSVFFKFLKQINFIKCIWFYISTIAEATPS